MVPKAHNDRRQFGRRSLIWHAWVVMNGRRRLPCMVRNISNSGALLEFTDMLPNTSHFRLVVEDQGLDIECNVRRVRDQTVGVYFSNAIFE